MTPTQLHVLVVEDNEGARELVCEMLLVLGHEPTGAASAEEALVTMKDKAFDVLLADINLPGMSGIALAEKIVNEVPNIHVIFASGFGYLVADKTNFQFTLLPKPYGLDQLRLALERP
jgi:CheY-like chemotaxis protein